MMAQLDPDELHSAMRMHAAGRVVEAERVFRSILSRIPDEPNASHMLGVILYQRGQLDLAEPLLKVSLKFADAVPGWHSNYALFCRASGRLDEAMKHLRRAIDLYPSAPESYDNLGLVLTDLGRHDEALEAYESAVRVRPDYVMSYHHLAQGLWNRGKHSEAIARWRRVVELAPNYSEGHGSLCFALSKMGQSSRALPHGERAVQLDPSSPDARVALAIAYGYTGRIEQGIQQLNEAIRLEPRHLAAMINLGWLLEASNQHDQAADYSRMALRIDPTNAQAMVNLSMSLCNLGELSSSLEWLRGALELDANHLQARSNLLGMVHFDPDVSREQLFEEHLKYDTALSARVGGKRFNHTNSRDPDRRLRIAYVSPDFKRHPVGVFIEAILRNHDRKSFAVSCYSTVRAEDDTTRRLRGLVDEWHDARELSDEELAGLIHRNAEDIAIDLAGHTSESRLPVFGYRPAPVQINYLGYVHTTGVSAIGYRITDPIVDPEGTSDRFYTEKLLRIPCMFCYEAPREAPAVGPSPAEGMGFITFGSLNQPVKFNAQVLKLWARILDEVPGSKLALMCGTSGVGAKQMRERLAAQGVAEDRFIPIGRQNYDKYLGTYNAIDIVLDPFPASGHTTTCDALWMGAPVITIPGEAYVSRLSTDVLTQLGLTNLIAGDPDAYVKIAVELARDAERRGSLRQTLRERMRASTMMDGPAVTRDLEGAYRRAWGEYCRSPA